VIGQKKFAFLEWAVFLALSVCAVVACEVIGLNQLWEDGVVYTVVVFAAILTTIRSVWGRKPFWKGLALTFIAHTMVLVAVLHELSPRRFGVSKFLLVPIGAIEGVVIGGILWKTMKTPSRHLPD
jgi:hypothetical protein